MIFDQIPRSVCVFCGSSSSVSQSYKDIARQVGDLIARNNWRLVYGGGRVGLMGEAANATLAAGGHVTGVIPGFLKAREIAHEGVQKMHVTETMHERQNKMAELSDAFIVLPGGMGTLAEFFEVLTWKQIGLHDKPVAILNAFGYWDSLLEMVKQGEKDNFIRKIDSALFEVFEKPENLAGFLDRTP